MAYDPQHTQFVSKIPKKICQKYAEETIQGARPILINSQPIQIFKTIPKKNCCQDYQEQTMKVLQLEPFDPLHIQLI